MKDGLIHKKIRLQKTQPYLKKARAGRAILCYPPIFEYARFAMGSLNPKLLNEPVTGNLNNEHTQYSSMVTKETYVLKDKMKHG